MSKDSTKIFTVNVVLNMGVLLGAENGRVASASSFVFWMEDLNLNTAQEQHV